MLCVAEGVERGLGWKKYGKRKAKTSREGICEATVIHFTLLTVSAYSSIEEEYGMVPYPVLQKQLGSSRTQAITLVFLVALCWKFPAAFSHDSPPAIFAIRTFFLLSCCSELLTHILLHEFMLIIDVPSLYISFKGMVCGTRTRNMPCNASIHWMYYTLTH